MNELRVTDPFAVDAMDDLFRGMLRPWRADLAKQAPQIKLDVHEDDKAYTVKAEVPGVGKDDIDVRIDGNQVTISAELKKESEEKQGRRVLRSERQYGFASRSFTLASDIDDAASTAKVENGVLELTLPKRSKASSRKLSVS